MSLIESLGGVFNVIAHHVRIGVCRGVLGWGRGYGCLLGRLHKRLIRFFIHPII